MTAVSPSSGKSTRARSANWLPSAHGSELRPPLSKVLAALEAWRNSPEWLKDGGRYIPHPATWLNRGGWEDELPAVRQQPESFI